MKLMMLHKNLRPISRAHGHCTLLWRLVSVELSILSDFKISYTVLAVVAIVPIAVLLYSFGVPDFPRRLVTQCGNRRL